MNGNTTDFAKVVTGFLTDYLPLQRGYSKNTILSYRDALKLFIVFLTEEKEIQLSRFTMSGFNRILTEYLLSNFLSGAGQKAHLSLRPTRDWRH